MTKKIFLVLSFILAISLSNNIYAQAPQQIGVVNSNDLIDAMPEKTKAKAQLEDLNNKYKSELTTMQNDYNKKYSDFISYQTSMGENIRLRRMQELYELERNINNFMKVAQEDVETKEKELLIPIKEKVRSAIYSVGVDNNFVCIYDLANPALAFVIPSAVDVTPLVKQRLGIR